MITPGVGCRVWRTQKTAPKNQGELTTAGKYLSVGRDLACSVANWATDEGDVGRAVDALLRCAG